MKNVGFLSVEGLRTNESRKAEKLGSARTCFSTDGWIPSVSTTIMLASKENGATVKCSEDAGMGAAHEESLPTNLQLIG